MTTALEFCARLLAASSLDNATFFEATAMLATRFDRHGAAGDLRDDDEAPKLLLDWYAHAEPRVPDIRVWDLSCQVEAFFDPVSGLYLPLDWPWDTRDRVLCLNGELRDRPEWKPVFERALLSPEASTVGALACCGAKRHLGVDPFPAVWSHLCEHVDDGFNWHLASRFIDEARLPEYLWLARRTVLTPEQLPVLDGLRETEILRMPDRARTGEEKPAREKSAAPPRRNLRREAKRGVHAYVWREIIEVLRNFPNDGIDLLECALGSGDLFTRLNALDALSDRSYSGQLPPDTLTLVRELAEVEDDEVARKGFASLLQGV